jgi:hypothetical protein
MESSEEMKKGGEFYVVNHNRRGKNRYFIFPVFYVFLFLYMEIVY